MKKVLSFGLMFLFSGLLFASSYESPPVEDIKNNIELVDDFTASDYVNVDIEFVNPNFSEDIEIANKEAYVGSFDAICYKQNDSCIIYNSNFKVPVYIDDDYKVIFLNDDNQEINKIFHEDPGNIEEVNYKSWNFEINYPSESPPKLE